jgi:hypothetical protein
VQAGEQQSLEGLDRLVTGRVEPLVRQQFQHVFLPHGLPSLPQENPWSRKAAAALCYVLGLKFSLGLQSRLLGILSARERQVCRHVHLLLWLGLVALLRKLSR